MKKILLADDSITIQKVVGIIFSTEEYQLEMTDDGDSAFQKALEDHPDLVIADISMPGKDGFELCRAIKSEPRLSGTSVLLLPGAFDHFDEAKAAEVCADGWLTKPFESQALLDKVAQLLEAEPLRMAGAADAETSDEVAEHPVAAAELTGTSADESVLGLEDVEAPDLAGGEIEEESPDDIWDAVSFEETDLAGDDNSDVEGSAVAASVAADVFGEETAVESGDTDVPAEPLESLSSETGDFAAPTVDDEPSFADGAFDPDAAESQSESFTAPDESVPSSESDTLSGASEEADNVDFSSFSDEENSQLAEDSFVDESSPFIAEVEEPAEPQNDFAEEIVAPVPDVAEPAVAEESGGEASAELSGDDTFESAAESVAVADSFTVESFDNAPVELGGEDDAVEFDDAPLELSEEDTVVELEPEEIPLDSGDGDTVEEPDDAPLELSEDDAIEEPEEAALDLSAEDEVVEFDDAPLELSEEDAIVEPDETSFVTETLSVENEGLAAVEEETEEILDLSEADIVPDEEIVETVDVADSEDESDVSALQGDDEPIVATEPEDVAESAEIVEAEEVVEAEISSEVEELVDDEIPEENIAPVVAVEDPEDEEDFYFDEPEDEEGDDELAVSPVSVVPAAAAVVSAAEDDAGPATAQVEQQLRELSEEELKEVVASVAGPIIEKLAAEMLEQIAWDVVPDLAEAMISEEIRKIKEGS